MRSQILLAITALVGGCGPTARDHGERSLPEPGTTTTTTTALEDEFDRIGGSEQWMGGHEDRKRR